MAKHSSQPKQNETARNLENEELLSLESLKANQRQLAKHLESLPDEVSQIINQQLELMQHQVDLIQKHTKKTSLQTPESLEKFEELRERFLQDFKSRYLEKTKLSIANKRAEGSTYPKEVSYPIYFEKSEGNFLFDVDGNRYINLSGKYGASVLGQTAESHKRTVEYELTLDQHEKSSIQDLEELKEKISSLLGHERVVFVESIDQALSSGLHCGKKRNKHNKVIVLTRPKVTKDKSVYSEAFGIPRSGLRVTDAEQTIAKEFGDDSVIELLSGETPSISSVVIDPLLIPSDQEMAKEYLHRLRKACDKAQCLLIMDETKTHYRLGSRGAQNYFGAQADLAIYELPLTQDTKLTFLAGQSKVLAQAEQPPGHTPRLSMLNMIIANTMFDILHHLPQESFDQIEKSASLLVSRCNRIFEELGAPFKYGHTGGLLYLNCESGLPYLDMLTFLLREHGLFGVEFYPHYLGADHSKESILHFEASMRASLRDMKKHGFFEVGPSQKNAETKSQVPDKKPTPKSSPMSPEKDHPVTIGQDHIDSEFITTKKEHQEQVSEPDVELGKKEKLREQKEVKLTQIDLWNEDEPEEMSFFAKLMSKFKRKKKKKAAFKESQPDELMEEESDFEDDDDLGDEEHTPKKGFWQKIKSLFRASS